jgi:hypothetical protein
MKMTKKVCGITLALTCSLAATLNGQNIYVGNFGSATIGEYALDGSTVNGSLVSNPDGPTVFAISGNDLFVGNQDNGTVGEYTTSGATVNASLISGLFNPIGVTVGPVPEPSTVALAGLGTAAFWFGRRRTVDWACDLRTCCVSKKTLFTRPRGGIGRRARFRF